MSRDDDTVDKSQNPSDRSVAGSDYSWMATSWVERIRSGACSGLTTGTFATLLFLPHAANS
jgi:hypothetical protein